MENRRQTASLLLQLPDSCLLAVLCCCADDPRTLSSPAQAHSKLQQAAVLAARSIRAVVSQQQRVSSILQYFNHHGPHVSSICLSKGPKGTVSLHQLPHDKLQGLSSLSISDLALQLRPGRSFRGVLGAGAPLKQLRLHRCTLLDKEKGKALVAALSALPELQHLSFAMPTRNQLRFPSHVLQVHQQLTYLEVTDVKLNDPDGLRHLQGLTRLQELRLQCIFNANTLQASMLSGMQHLSVLKLHSPISFDLGILAGKLCLQHLQFVSCWLSSGPTAGVSELLSHLHSLQQLTHLQLTQSLLSHGSDPPAAGYSALTASSKLQHLDISGCTLPAGVWRHMFPAGRQLPHLRTLVIDSVCHCQPHAATAPDVSLFVSCCPGLQSLSLQWLQYSRELLAPLTGLSSLTELYLCPEVGYSEGFEVVRQLTGLRRLHLIDHTERGGLLPLTQLKRLTELTYWCCIVDDYGRGVTFVQEAPGDEPVWRQVLQHLLNHSDPAVAQQAAAALAE